MVLRKPYGFLIKHFRFIHLLITVILAYIAVKFRNIYVFLGNVISDAVNRYDAVSYINYKIFIFIVLSIFLMFIVYWLLKYKDKPRKIYIISIIGYIILGIVLMVVFSYMSGFSMNIINQKTIRLYRDILFICNLFQYYIIIVMLIRGLGFDIKKFNFAKDVQELNLSQEDNEEVEVNIGIDTTSIVREVRKQKREFGYFFKEYKIYIIGIIILIVFVLGYNGYNYFSNKYKVYSQNQYVGEVKYINIIDSYYDITDDNNYIIIIKFNAYTNGTKDKLNTGNIMLSMNGEKYSIDKNICYKYNYLGVCYKQQYIDNTESEYILVYDVDALNIEKAYILYSESYEKNYKVKLKPMNIKSD